MSETSTPQGFDDILEANRDYASTFTSGGFDGIAKAGIGIVTCMDSRIEPLKMLGLELGDAKIFRNPGARMSDNALEALVLGVHLLNVKRIMIVPHTRCAVGTNSEELIREKVSESAGVDVTWHPFNVVTDQVKSLGMDVHRVRSHPLIPETVQVGGFMYDVDTGLLDQKF
ncbi:beta-class carbonic anhydrase [Nocardioides bruguierae]|uniref:carbonic anhydrase n=1 Tax=Nocardioides bruguierae TaxID=2945102 RepID=A0A9X2D5R2_9ACTN|nr:carbonic anhydrase [Nocardioides bruguierae]MCL8024327.1 carbonic anhydrase [Nocardioides bruguierae]MCM0618794.1 carbonic anhydrase [Nocardioides bruguierae]